MVDNVIRREMFDIGDGGSKTACPYCGSGSFIRYGRNSAGKQRYHSKECNVSSQTGPQAASSSTRNSPWRPDPDSPNASSTDSPAEEPLGRSASHQNPHGLCGSGHWRHSGGTFHPSRSRPIVMHTSTRSTSTSPSRCVLQAPRWDSQETTPQRKLWQEGNQR